MTAGDSGAPELSPLVLKFGGSAFHDLDGYRRIADYVASRVAEEGRRAIVVVSAMSGTTGRLQDTLREVSQAPPPAVSSMILTTGEIVSVALLTAVLDTHDLTVQGLTGDQIGMIADGPRDRARLRTVDQKPLSAAIEQSSVVVLPGGQAVDDAGQLVMLGRNSSDLSAVAAAIAVEAGTCELFSDVPGICSADPFIVPTARVLPAISFDTMRQLASGGAKVIHGEALRWAQDHGVRLMCRSLPPASGDETIVDEGPPVAAVALHERGDVWSFHDPDARARAARKLVAVGLDALVLDDPHHLVATAYGSDDLAARCCVGGRLHRDLCLLTVLHQSGRREQLILPRTEGIGEARRRHDLLYPAHAGLNTFAPTLVKPRSAHSGMLVGKDGI